MGMWVAFCERNRRPARFHYVPRWIDRGTRACDGRDMTHAGWTTDEHHPAPHLKTCKHCEKVAAREAAKEQTS